MKFNYVNDTINYLKLFLGLALILFPLSIAVLLIISYPKDGVFELSDDLSLIVFFIFGRNEGVASNVPIMFGLMVLSGVLLLNKVRFTSNKK